MIGGVDQGGEIAGFTVPVHRALTEPILLGGAPRGLAILNGTWPPSGPPSAIRSSSMWCAAICASPAIFPSEGDRPC
jgi:hypothetical protein